MSATYFKRKKRQRDRNKWGGVSVRQREREEGGKHGKM